MVEAEKKDETVPATETTTDTKAEETTTGTPAATTHDVEYADDDAKNAVSNCLLLCLVSQLGMSANHANFQRAHFKYDEQSKVAYSCVLLVRLNWTR